MAHIVISSNTAWSVLNFRRNLIEALLADGHRITAISPDGPEADDIRAFGCDFVPVSIDRRGSSVQRDLRLMRNFHQIFREIKPDAIISYTIKNNIYGGVAARWLRIPFLPVVTGLGAAFGQDNLLGRIVVALYRWGFRDSERVYFLNSDDGAAFGDRGILRADQIHYLPGEGIDVERFNFRPLPADRPRRFIYLGRILREKGAPEYLQAAEVLNATRGDCVFEVLGFVDPDNPDSMTADELADYQARGVIEYHGPAGDVREYLAAVHCIVLPTYYREGVPRVLLEAAAIGRPIITTDTVGCRDVVDVGVNGLFCKAKDAADLARQMEQIADAPIERLAEMGAAGRAKIVDEFRDELVVRHFKDWLETVL